MPSQPVDVAVVATWYPSALDRVRGRFVADQVAALTASGRVRASVVSFDPAALIGTPLLRERLAGAVASAAATAIGQADDVFTWGAVGEVEGAPVARLPVADGHSGADPRVHAMAHREAALMALARRWTASPPDPALPPRPGLIH
ncbi:MAG TPA: hypothetical protein VMH24_04195, partial [Candidatus Sulfotelmatobacter sp.]|nr:hypothetical protein [Candidatus Sulfotelmatobacter sp.]